MIEQTPSPPLPSAPPTRGRPRTRALPDTDVTRRLVATRQRLVLTKPRMAAYLGVPVATYQSWEMGVREPSASALRLLDVLGIVEALAPGVHAELLR